MHCCHMKIKYVDDTEEMPKQKQHMIFLGINDNIYIPLIVINMGSVVESKPYK